MAVMIGVGAMMGPGVFALPAEVAQLVGPLGVLSYLALGLVVIPTALTYAELGAAVPLAGGGYSFVSRTLPRPVAFITGWFFWIGNTLAASMYALIFALTIQDFLPGAIPATTIAAAVTLAFTALNMRGMHQSMRAIAAMNLVELFVLAVFAVLGVLAVEPANLSPVAPHGVSGFLPSMAVIYVSFVGFDLIAVAGEEIIDPGRTIPRAILITIGVGIAVYVAVVFVMMGAVPHDELAQSDVPFVFAADRIFGPWGRWAGMTATIMACLSAFAVTIGASARILYALARDGHIPKALGALHPRYGTPHVALVLGAIVIIGFASSGVVKLVASISAFGYLCGQGVVNLALVALHRKMPNLRRPFRTAGFPRVPLLGAITCWMFVPALELRSLALGMGMAVVGGAIYFGRPANWPELARIPGIVRQELRRIRHWRRSKMRVLIIGGGKQGQDIARRLLAKDEHRLIFRSHDHQITFVEQNPELCDHLEKEFGVPIYQGDGTKHDILDQVGVGNVDVAVAATSDDRHNLIASLQAKRLGMQQVIAIVHDPDYIPLLEQNGVVAISAPWATAAMVENYLDRPGVAELFEIGSGIANVVGVIIPQGGRAAGTPIRELAIPGQCVVAAVIRGQSFVVPRGDTQIEVGDHVIFVGPADAVKRAQDLMLVEA